MSERKWERPLTSKFWRASARPLLAEARHGPTQDTPAPIAPYEVFRRLDLGPGGYARAAACDAKSALRAAIARKHSQ